ncbi:synoviolin 1 isoform b [Ephemerocybe angulata]|uniref:RING-type E3 ubiquitin transferase n=1 Tax=Ephemerocybe angulata TaxID=980116 RepID=A0A8H6I8W3_9AGAR|nr:synoviolin 1 isoform b [Tulosesus angulatus]
MPSNEVLRQRLHNVAQFANTHRLLIYTFTSLLALGVVITNALKNYSNFYSVAIYLSKSSRSVLALANFGFLITLLCGYLVQRIFFGSLRANEVERLYDRLWFFITESLLAFTIFRDEFDTPFACMFGFLLFVKSFHWLASDRIEWMDQRPYPGPPLLFHIRMVTLFTILWVIDMSMFLFTVEHTLSVGVGGMVLFASEYGILIASVMNTISKYGLSAYELRRAGQRGGENAPPWENKSMWVFYIELATDFLKLTIYLMFFVIIITFYGLPLNIVRDVYITARSFISRLRALHRYQTATRNMDQRYPNATEEELSAMSDRTCIICREEMVYHAPESQGESRDGPNMSPKKLPCGHIFHFYCLRSWLERQQSCPTCRRTVLDANIPPNPRANNPPPPAPGAVPQPPNAAAPRQGGNEALGNPLGFANRFFGPPGQDANNAPPTPNPAATNQQGQNPGAGAAHNPLRIQYDLQYQPLHGQGFPPQQIPPNTPGQHPLVPVPTFPGFQGVGGAPQPEATARQSSGAGTSGSATSNPQTQAFSTAATRSRSPAESDSGSDSDSSSNNGETNELSPREAARVAALRRFGGNGQTLVPTKTTPVPADGTVRTSSPATSAEAPSQPRPRDHPYPRLIPLYDLDATPQSSPYPTTSHTQYFPQPTPTIPLSSVPPAFQQRASFAPLTPSAFAPHSANHLFAPPPSAQLRTPLTEEDLARMDRLTRDAIDERLRVLERVSNNLYGAMDDLMRMRSALPQLPSPGPNVANHVDPGTSGSNLASPSARQEEKRPERSQASSGGLVDSRAPDGN